MRRRFNSILLLACGLLAFACVYSARADSVSTSALISAALDRQIPSLSVQGGLVDVMRTIESQTGVRVTATEAVWELLPWGNETSLTVNVKNTTLRQALDSIVRHLGLVYTLGPDSVKLEPSPALSRLGRRATLDEVQLLELCASTQASVSSRSPTIGQLLAAIDQQLADLKSPFSVQDRAFGAAADRKTIQLARNATMGEALDELSFQTNATWYPSGNKLVIVKKVESIRLLLDKRVTRRFHDVGIDQVLLELSEAAGIPFNYEPGSIQLIPAAYQRVNLALDDATIRQTLEVISGATGLRFSPTDDGLNVSYVGPTTAPVIAEADTQPVATQPLTRPATRP